jgi:hypothetical protein
MTRGKIIFDCSGFVKKRIHILPPYTWFLFIKRSIAILRTKIFQWFIGEIWMNNQCIHAREDCSTDIERDKTKAMSNTEVQWQLKSNNPNGVTRYGV